jgi:hypothetical protein
VRATTRRAAALGVIAVLLTAAGCSSNQANKQVEQNAKLWGTAACGIAEADDAQSQQDSFGQANQYSQTAVQLVPSMSQGAAQIDAQVATLNADKTAQSTVKLVPDLKAVQDQATTLAKGSSGDESDGWNSLSGSLADCIAQLPPGLQGG